MMMDLLPVNALAAMALFSVLALLLSIIIVPWFIVQLPGDYFVSEKRKKVPWAGQHIVLRYLLLTIKNLLGYIIIVAGLIMLVLPGQGVLSIIAGVMLIDFPGKFHVERRLVQWSPVLTVSNKLRKAAHKEPFRFHE